MYIVCRFKIPYFIPQEATYVEKTNLLTWLNKWCRFRRLMSILASFLYALDYFVPLIFFCWLFIEQWKVSCAHRMEFTLFNLFSLFEFTGPAWHLHSLFIKVLWRVALNSWTNIESSYLDIWFSISRSTFCQIIYYLSVQPGYQLPWNDLYDQLVRGSEKVGSWTSASPRVSHRFSVLRFSARSIPPSRGIFFNEN